MKLYYLKREQLVLADIERVWSFFSDPTNLAVITPPELDFVTTSEQIKDHTYPGQIITYTIRPVGKIKVAWATEISHVTEREFFVDEQRRGPYAFWHHQHHFKETKEGVLMTDIVHYGLPLGLIGLIAHKLFVKKKLEQIFDYRASAIHEIFNEKE